MIVFERIEKSTNHRFAPLNENGVFMVRNNLFLDSYVTRMHHIMLHGLPGPYTNKGLKMDWKYAIDVYNAFKYKSSLDLLIYTLLR